MRRVLSVWLPTFATDLVKRRLDRDRPCAPGDRGRNTRPSHRAILLTRPVASRELVSRRCALAARAGVTEEMDLAHARSLIPSGVHLHVEPHRPDRDAAALHSLACWAVRFSPLVAPDPPDGLILDITGTERLHKGEVKLIRGVAAGIHRLGFSTRITGASTFACAWALSHFGADDLSRVPPGREKDALANLPVQALRIDDSIVQGLEEVGITCIGHVLALPRPAVASRFEAALLDRVDRATGRTYEKIDPVRPAPPARSELIFDGPTDQWESIEAAARHVLEALCAELARRERGVRRLDLSILRPRASPESIEVVLSRPSRNMRHLWSLLRTRLERADLGQGVEGMMLTASRTARLRHEQASSRALGANREEATTVAWGEVVDTLVSRLGADNVVWLEPVESHLPERAFRERSVMDEHHPSGKGNTIGDTTKAVAAPLDRPTRLFIAPEPVQVMALTPDGPVLSLRWRGEEWRALSCTGPERISPEWWNWDAAEPLEAAKTSLGRVKWNRRRPPPPPDRDYFALQTQTGRWLWLCRQAGTTQWFVHGEWS